MDFFHRFGVFKLQTLCLTLIIFFLNYSSKIFLFFSINLSISIYFPLMTNLTLFFFFFLFFFLSFYIFFTNPSNCSLFFTQQFWTLVYISFFPPLFSHFIIFFPWTKNPFIASLFSFHAWLWLASSFWILLLSLVVRNGTYGSNHISLY